MNEVIFGGGCFWCLEALFVRVKGVESVISGYAGGNIPHPTYKEVCSGLTGHAEVIQVTYDESIISYEELLTIFLTSHDPTTVNRQGADVGTQYRSIIIYQNESEQAMAEEVVQKLQAIYSQPIVTELAALKIFYAAEDYHQNYYDDNRKARYCKIVIDPKVNKLRKEYGHLLKAEIA